MTSKEGKLYSPSLHACLHRVWFSAKTLRVVVVKPRPHPSPQGGRWVWCCSYTLGSPWTWLIDCNILAWQTRYKTEVPQTDAFLESSSRHVRTIVISAKPGVLSNKTVRVHQGPRSQAVGERVVYHRPGVQVSTATVELYLASLGQSCTEVFQQFRFRQQWSQCEC